MDKQELKIEDLKASDELECIDREGYVNQDNGHARIRKQILKGPIVVCEIKKNGVSLTRSSFQIPLDSLKHFKKKEEQPRQYTFGDLIDVAVQAYKDGVSTIKIDTKIRTVFVEELRTTYGVGHIDLGIKKIKSLYNETFVIESEEDFEKIKIKAKGTLLNGNKFTVEGKTHSSVYGGLLEVHADFTNRKDRLSFLSVKGATVEQPK